MSRPSVNKPPRPAWVGVATYVVIGLAAFGGAGLTVSAAIVVERALQRRAAR